MVELALIPPLSLVDDYVNDGKGTFLFLPQLIGSDPYDRFMWRATTELSHTILDNGAYEGMVVTSGRVMDLARHYNVKEVVVPDTLRDAERTAEQVARFGLITNRSRNSPTNPKFFMAVLQGTTIAECEACFTAIVKHAPWVTTIGLPKHLLTTIAPDARTTLTKYIRSKNMQHAIHFLGCAPRWPSEIVTANRLGLNVRSMDTSLPFVLAHMGKRIEDCTTDIPRPNEYFRLPRSEFDPELVLHNVSKLREWCAGA